MFGEYDRITGKPMYLGHLVADAVVSDGNPGQTHHCVFAISSKNKELREEAQAPT